MQPLLQFFQSLVDVIIQVVAAPARAMIETTQSALVTGIVFGSCIIGGAMIYHTNVNGMYNDTLMQDNAELQHWQERDAMLRSLRTELTLKQDFPNVVIPE